MSLGGVFLGLILMGVGTLMLKFNFQIVGMIGRNNVFEQKLGSGVTYPLMQLVALIVVLFGFFLMFGVHDNVLKWVFSPLTNLFRR